MKRFFIAATAISAMALSVNAGTINLDMRADHVSDNYNEEAGQRNASRFNFKTIRANFEGKVNDSLTFRLRGAYNKDATRASALGDNSQTALEYAYLTHKMGDVAFPVGRFFSEAGGLEAATTGPDLYLQSMIYGKTGPIAVNGNWLSTQSLLYVTGAKLAYTFAADQTLSLVAFEVPGALTTDNANMTGLGYRGSFMDKSLKVMANYHTGNGTGVTADKYEVYGLGVAWTMDPLFVSADYVSSGFKADVTGLKDVGTAIIGKVGYSIDQWTPRLEVISAENKVETSATPANNRTEKWMGYGAVVEYRPMSEFKDFRYHVAYHTITQDQLGKGDANVQTITVGTRLYADFLK